ncbi:MAG: heavy-metal-associated domain-containing protein [Alkalispirochaeta sp.]
MKTVLRSNELSCPSCIVKIEKRLTGLPGVETAKVRFNTGRIEVVHDETTASQDALISAVREVGYESEVSAI